MFFKLQKKLMHFLDSDWFFYSFVIIFLAETLWLSLVSRYQMAFDEAHHFELIQFFSHHWSPIITHQQANTYNLGALNHYSSFLYHYLMSFPYRLLIHITHTFKVIVISLRIINISLAVLNLFLLRCLFKLVDAPKLIANLVIFVFAFTPIVSVLSAQINYDNLVILITSLSVYLSVSFLKQLNQNKLNLKLLLSLVCLCVFGGLVKYAFLAVSIGISLLLIFSIWRYYNKTKKLNIWRDLGKSYATISNVYRATLISLVILGTTLFGIFYGVNIIKFHNPVPTCDQILTIKDCSHYYAWNRNHDLAIHKIAGAPIMNIFQYILSWAKVMYYQIFAEIIPTGGLVPIEPIFRDIAFGFTGVCAFATIHNWRRIYKNKNLILLSFVSVIYLIILLARNYHDYLQLGKPVAVQGRFLLPVLIYIYALFGYGIYFVLKGRKTWQVYSTSLLIIVIIGSFLYWGGFARYRQVISPNYRWPKNLPTIST